jgi:imidazolonepropionase-like amidohydrolase
MVRAFAPWWIEWYIAPRIAHAVATPEEARAAVDALAEEGVDAVKVIVDRIPDDAPRISNDVLAAVTERAHERGLRVVAHIGTTEDALDCARAGVDLFVHGVYRERIPDAGIAELARHGIPMVATFEVFERYARTGEGPRAATLLERETASAALLGSFHPVPDDFDPGVFGPFIELMRETREARLDNVRRLRAAGITILAGSDAQSGVFPGPGLHRELAWLVRSGMSPAEAIRGATLDAARFLANGAEPDFGQVAVGRRADLLLVDGNPARDVGALESIRTVFLGGIPLERAPVPGS